MRLRLALLLALAACRHTCPAPTTVQVPVVVKPPTCLQLVGDPPAPPNSEDDRAWARYHVDLEAWVAKVQRSCR